MRLLVTGGAGFIGSAVVRHFVAQGAVTVVNVDKLTYAGNLNSLTSVKDAPNYDFEQVDICSAASMRRIFRQYAPDAVLNLAAESHVDRSIDKNTVFLRTNVQGTHVLLNTALDFWRELDAAGKRRFRFVQVSTDEVYGDLGPSGLATEGSAYAPSSPYAASKAASDHLVRAWFHTYGLPTIISHCCNNYGPYQFPEKLIPMTILNALDGSPIPVYGRGENVRQWIYVDDHVAALETILREGSPGKCYGVSGDAEVRNIDVVRAICSTMDEMVPRARPYAKLINFVVDRPGHDFRYSIDASKTSKELGWRPQLTFASGLRLTVAWWLTNADWWRPLRTNVYRGERLGTGNTAADTHSG